MNNSPARAADMRATLRQAAASGRGGDDRIAHINGFEAAILKALGGAGSINPETGLEEYKYGGNVSEGGKTQGAKDAGGQGHNAGGRGGGSFGGGGGSFGTGRGPGRETSAYGGSPAFGGGRHNRAGSNANQSGRGGGTFMGGSGLTRDQMQEQDQLGANVAKALDDKNNVGNSGLDNFGNLVASFLGLNEMDPTVPGFSGPGMPGQTGRADWGFDPAGAIGGALGTAFGVPFVGGFLADQISAAAGRPMEVNLGPDVFSDPETGQTTHTAGSMSIHDGGDKDTFYGAPPALAGFGGGVSSVAPGRTTFTGTDPAPVDQPAEGGFTPTTPNPGEYDAPNSPVQIDQGNLSNDQLSNLFSNFLQPSRTSKGRNAMRVVV